MNAPRSGGRILVDQLVAQGCDRIFTVPGESFLPVLDALHDTPAIDLVVCRHEGGAALMAEADGKLTGRPGIAFVTRGPGATNASIGVHVARQDSTPMILFVGDVGRDMRDREAFQEVDLPAMFAPLAKWAARIEDAARIPEYVTRAYATAVSGRPGPVVLALPENVLGEMAEAADRPLAWRAPQQMSPLDALDIAEAVARAEHPVAIVGGAGWNAWATDEIARFSEAHGLPVVGAFRRQDTLSNTFPTWAGSLGYGPNPKLVERIRSADLLLVIGARLGEATTDGYSLIHPDHPKQRLIHIHPDPHEMGSVYAPDELSICASVDFATQKLVYATTDLIPDGDVPIRLHDAAEAHADYLEWSTPRPREGVALDLGQCVLAMREALPADTIICNGAGNFSAWWHRYWRYAGPVSQLAPTCGAMGYGVPAGIAASLRKPDRQVVVVAGDGDFLMTGQELATAVRHRVRLLFLVIDNGSYGTIRMHQEREYPGRVAGTDLANPDFAALARAYGVHAETVETTAAFCPALERARAAGLALLHLKTDIEQISPAATISSLRERNKDRPC